LPVSGGAVVSYMLKYDNRRNLITPEVNVGERLWRDPVTLNNRERAMAIVVKKGFFMRQLAGACFPFPLNIILFAISFTIGTEPKISTTVTKRQEWY